MSLTTSPQIQMQILQHQLHTINRKKQQSQFHLLLLQDIATCLLLCTFSILSVALFKQGLDHVAKAPLPLNRQQQQQQRYGCNNNVKWFSLQYPITFFGSVVAGIFQKAKTNNCRTNGNKSNNNQRQTQKDATSASCPYTIENEAIVNAKEIDQNANDRPNNVELESSQEQLHSGKEASQIPLRRSVPVTIDEKHAPKNEAPHFSKGQKKMTNAKNMNDDRDSATTESLTATNRRKTYYKYLEILVHNVSHTDLVLGLDLPSVPLSEKGDCKYLETQVPPSTIHSIDEMDKRNTSDERQRRSGEAVIRDLDESFDEIRDDDIITSPYMKNYIRPRFSSFDLYCRLVLNHLTEPQNHTISTSTNINNFERNDNHVGHDIKSDSDKTTTIIHFPRYHRSMIDPRYAIRQFQDQLATKKKYVPPKMAPTGIQLLYPVSLPVTTPSSLQDHHIEDTIRIRGRDAPAILSALKCGSSSSTENKSTTDPADSMVSIKYVFFPLLATLLPVWYRQIKEKEYQEPVKRVLILVTGVGTPRNYTHSIHGNSTEACADLMKVFVSNIDPTLSVVKVFSNSTNIFRTDENILFCERELIPLINAYRNAHVMGTSYPDDEDYVPILDETTVFFNDDTESDWRTRLNVTLSFADGSPARTQAIQSSLRSYKPTYFHFWQLKTFWHESKIVDDDIEVHSFATMESKPAIDTTHIRDPYLQAVVSEMRAFYDEMITALNNNDNDIDRFWLRKSHKPVLAVLLVQPSSSTPTPDSKVTPSFRLYRGTNMEVSMPTGSLCAERNAIGSALAMNPNLKRHDLKMIAVLAVPPLDPPPTNITPVASLDHNDGIQMDAAGAASGKGVNLGDSISRITDNIRRITSYSSIVEELIDPNDDDDASINDPYTQLSIDERSKEYFIRKSSIGSDYEPTTTTTTTNTATNDAITRRDAVINAPFCLPVGGDGNDFGLDEKISPTTSSNRRIPSEPVRRIPLFPKAPSTAITTETLHDNVYNSTSATFGTAFHKTVPGRMQQKTKRTVVVQSHKDMNPLSPCGACNEWIKKIAQCNPYFKIITFTDANCNGMYISPCQD